MVQKGFLFLFLWTSLSYAEDFFRKHTQGWHWYEVLPFPEEEEIQDLSIPAKTPSEIIQSYREQLEKKLHTAWVNPTPQNLQAYQEMQKDMIDRSQLFSLNWMRTVFTNPQLDHTLLSPVNHQGRHLQIDQEKQQIQKTIQALSQTHGLFFFFASDCPYCHQFAPIVKRFSELYGWDVIAISLDGGTLPDFPKAEKDNSLFQTWGLKSLPCLFAVQPETRQAFPLATGLISLDEIQTRIMTLVGTA